MRQSASLEQAVRDMVRTMNTSDLDATEAVMSDQDGVVVIGTDVTEYTRGREQIMQLIRDSMPDGSVGGTFTVNEVHAYEHGDMGWFDSLQTFESAGRLVAMRCTGVVQQQDGRWRVVQEHASIGVPFEHQFDPMFTSAATPNIQSAS